MNAGCTFKLGLSTAFSSPDYKLNSVCLSMQSNSVCCISVVLSVVNLSSISYSSDRIVVVTLVCVVSLALQPLLCPVWTIFKCSLELLVAT